MSSELYEGRMPDRAVTLLKEGDIVTVAKDLEEGHLHRYYVNKEMEKLRGCSFEVKRVDTKYADITLCGEGISQWRWTGRMLGRVFYRDDDLYKVVGKGRKAHVKLIESVGEEEEFEWE